MGFTVVIAAINSIKVAETIGMGDQARMFSIVSLSALAMFVVLVTLAIVNIANPEAHKRFMLIATVSLLQAAVARVFRAVLAPTSVGPPQVAISIPPGLVADLLLVALAVYDWRTRGKVHPVTMWAGGAVVLLQVIRLPLSATPVWMAIARAVEALAG